MAGASPSNPVFCHRCGASLTPGDGRLYLVRIEAFADPYPPEITDEDLRRDTRREMAEAIADMEGASERELHDEVHRRLTLTLCPGCYRRWIENPTG